jgi:6-pyruvoyltetrahydropterin/6-carboxytetrahydropterin synthase
MAARVTIVKTFTFDAAHFLPSMPEGHRYRRLHGHSFQVELALTGTPDPAHGWVQDFEEIAAAIAEMRETLDHHCLNDIPGLEQPSLETIAAWIWDRARPALPALSRVTIRRDSCGEACIYEGPEAV